MSTRDQNLEYVVWHFIRMHYETKFDRQHIPIALKYIVSQFSKQIIPCNMLTFKEDLSFYQLLSSNIKSPLISKLKSLKVLYKASENKYLSELFQKKCADKPNTITIIKSDTGNIFGGYRSTKFNETGIDIKETDSFLFLIRSKDITDPVAFPLIQPTKFDYYTHRGPHFGSMALDISIKEGNCNEALPKNTQLLFTCGSWNYTCKHKYDSQGQNLSGTDVVRSRNNLYDLPHFFQIEDYIVIQILS